MRFFAVFLFVTALVAPRAAAAQGLSYTWADTLSPEKVDQLLNGFAQAAQADPASFEMREKAALFSFYAWRLEKKDNRRRLNLATLTVRFGKEMIALAPNRAEGHHWLGAGLGLIGLTRGVLNSLQLVPQLREQLEKSIALDPDYLEGNAQASLGRVYTVLPAFPLSIGSKEKALSYLVEARKRGANFTLTTLYIGDVLWAYGRNDEAVAELEKIAAMKPKTEPEYFLYEVNRKKAEELIKLIRSGVPRDPFIDVLSDIQPGLVN